MKIGFLKRSLGWFGFGKKGSDAETAGTMADASAAPAENATPASADSSQRALLDPKQAAEIAQAAAEADTLTPEQDRQLRRKRQVRTAVATLDQRRQRDARIQAIMSEVIGTLLKVGKRLDQETARGAEIDSCLEKLPEILARLPQDAEKEREIIESMARHLRGQREFQVEAVDHMRALPQIVEAVQSTGIVDENRLAAARQMATNYAQHCKQIIGIGDGLDRMAGSVGQLCVQQGEQTEKLALLKNDLDAGLMDLSAAQSESRDRLLSSRAHFERSIAGSQKSTARRFIWALTAAAAVLLLALSAGFLGVGWHVEALQRTVETRPQEGLIAFERAQRLGEENLSLRTRAIEDEQKARALEIQVFTLREISTQTDNACSALAARAVEAEEKAAELAEQVKAFTAKENAAEAKIREAAKPWGLSRLLADEAQDFYRLLAASTANKHEGESDLETPETLEPADQQTVAIEITVPAK